VTLHGLAAPELAADYGSAACLEKIVAACRARGIAPGIHASAALAARRREMGFRMITVSADQLALGDGARVDLKRAREGVGASGGRAY
jgi:2-keto-3-deoxy-L-rhamnonate aldolase RhmA